MIMSLITSKATLIIRKENNLKYADVKLPNKEDDTCLGYHKKCYRRFTAFSSTQRNVTEGSLLSLLLKEMLQKVHCFLFYSKKCYRRFTAFSSTQRNVTEGSLLSLLLKEMLQKVHCFLFYSKKCYRRFTAFSSTQRNVTEGSLLSLLLKEMLQKVHCFLFYSKKCYRRFTAFSSTQRNKLEERVKAMQTDQSKERITRSSISSPQSSSTGVFKHSCLFWRHDSFMLKGTRRHLSSAQTNEFENNIKMYAHLLEDEEMLLNIRNIGFVEKEVHYHAICRSRYQRKAEASATTEDCKLGLGDGIQQTGNTHAMFMQRHLLLYVIQFCRKKRLK